MKLHKIVMHQNITDLWPKKEKRQFKNIAGIMSRVFILIMMTLQASKRKYLRWQEYFPCFLILRQMNRQNRLLIVIKKRFLQAGGVVTTLETTGQQWDAPNGWAPLQWMTITGLENYGHHELAAEIAKRWIRLNTDVFKRTGKLMEKYNVVDTHLEAGGGEYPGQDGFGWTNGVLLALIKKYGSGE